MATARSDIEVRVRGTDQLTPELSRIESRIIRFVGAVSSALAAVRIVGFPVTAVREFEREMANVQKTTGFTSQEINSLGNSIKRLSGVVDIGAADLGKIAAAAGQQGLGREGVAGVLAFTESVARMSSVLDVSVEEAGAAVGKLASIFRVPLTEIENLISSMNEVANNSTATGTQLLDVTRRIGDAAGAFDDYYKTIAIGAAAIDFGASAEVVGTSLTKVFADMQSKAEKFSAFMGMSTHEWINIVQTDGINAFKMYLEQLRTLEGESRQRTIRELSGTGRIGAMLNKFVNDTTNTVLDRNLDSARRGREGGESALKEQSTVLKTLDAQVKILGNSFQNLGIQAGERFAKPLTSFIAQLSASLQDPAVLTFAESLGDMFLSLFTTVQEGLVFLASLNVNWENFIALAKVLVAIKLSEMMVNWVARLSGLDKVLQSTSKSAEDAAKALDGVGADKDGPAGFRDILAGYREQNAATKAQIAATEQLRIAEKARADAQVTHNRNLAAQRKVADSPVVQAATTNLGTARRAAYNSRTTMLAAEQAAVTAHQTRVQQRERQHQETITRLETEYTARRRALKEQGRTGEIRTLRKAHTERLASEKLTYDRSMTQINAYYAKRIASARTAAAEEARVAQAGVLAARQEVSRANNAVGTGVVAASVALSGKALKDSIEGVSNAKQALENLGPAMTRTQKLAQALGTGFALLRTSLSWIFSAAMRVTWFGFLAYQIADMVGLVDKLAPAFRRLASAVGLYSEQARKAAQAEADRQRAMIEEQAEIQNLIDKYHELRDASTGQLRETELAALPTMLQDKNAELNRQAISTILDTIKGASAELQRADIRGVSLIEETSETEEKIKKTEALLKAAQERLARSEEALTAGQLARMRDPTVAAGAVTPQMRALARAQREVREIEATLKNLDAAAQGVVKTLGQDLSSVAEAAKADLASIAPVLEGMFTTETAEVFTRYAGGLAEMRSELYDLNEERKQSIQNELRAQSQGEEAVAAQARQTQEITDQMLALQARIRDVTKDLNKEITELETSPGVSTELLNSAGLLRTLLALSPADLAALKEAVGLLEQAGATFSGQYAPPPAPPSTGESSYGDGESGAKGLARARLALLKAQSDAEAKIHQDAIQEQLTQNQYLFDRNLASIREYYNRKQALQLEDLGVQMRVSQTELEGVQQEIAQATKEVDRLRAQASAVRLEGDIRALEARRSYIVAQIERDRQLTLQTFRDDLSSASLGLATFFGDDDAALFSLALDTYTAQYRDFINRLKSEAEGMPELLPVIDQIKLRNDFTAASLVVGEIGRGLQADVTIIERYTDRLEMMREKGVITTSDLAKGMDDARAAQVALYEVSVARMEAQLADLPRESLAYKELALDIDEVRLRMEQLATEANAVAKEINEGFTQELTSMFQNFRLTDDISETLLNTLLGFLQQLQNVLGQGLAEGIMASLNNAIGGDGVGGFFADLFGMTGDGGKPDGTLTNPLHVVQSGFGEGINLKGTVDGLFGGGGDDPLGDFIADLGGVMDPVPEEMGFSLTSFLGGFSGSISNFLSGAGGLFNNLLGGLSNILSGLFGGGGGGGIGGMLTSLVGLFHTGGRVGGGGSRTTRRVNPAVFHGAPRYHSGTLNAGLKPGEMPAILEEGETVRTEEQERMLQRQLGGAGGGGGAGVTSIKSVLVMDPSIIPEAMQASAGEKVVMTHIQQNAPTIRALLQG